MLKVGSNSDSPFPGSELNKYRAMALGVGGLVFGALLFGSLAKVDVVVTGDGSVSPDFLDYTLSAPRSGEMSLKAAENGDALGAGDLILEFNCGSEERGFHLYQGQPIPPSKAQYELYELHVSLQSVMAFPTLDALKSIGMDVAGYGQAAYFEKEREYPRSQEIAEACSFLGADGILVPSARDQAANNLIVFCEQDTTKELKIVKPHGVINWTVM